MGGVAVVTDSTADLPPELAEAAGIRVVPLSVQFGDEQFVSRITLSDEEFYARLRDSDVLPTTSQPAPAWFEEAYADAADDGLDAVVSIHLSAGLSGTTNLARRLAADAPLPVHVLDSRQVGGGLGLIALAAQRRATAGGSVDEVLATARTVADGVRTVFVVDTLDHLRRGGRLSGAQAVVGNVLRVKPLLGIRDGEVVPLERARTWGRALDRMAALGEEGAGGASADVVVAHAGAPERARELWERLGPRLRVAQRVDTVVGPVVGAHTGPGAIGLAVAPHPA